jgi:hypothetical protein
MDKLQREKRNSKRILSAMFYDRFVRFNFDDAPIDWEWHRKWTNKVNTRKRVFPKKYITNTDVCNID